jgi:hypothetical protein
LGVVRSSVRNPHDEKYATTNLIILHDIAPLSESERTAATSFEHECLEPPYIVLTDSAFGSYVLALARVRPELVSARMDEGGTYMSLDPHVADIANTLFVEGRKRSQIGFCYITREFPPRDLQPGGKWRIEHAKDEKQSP